MIQPIALQMYRCNHSVLESRVPNACDTTPFRRVINAADRLSNGWYLSTQSSYIPLMPALTAYYSASSHLHCLLPVFQMSGLLISGLLMFGICACALRVKPFPLYVDQSISTSSSFCVVSQHVLLAQDGDRADGPGNSL